MKRIFYFTGHRLTALHWQGKNFIGACSFEPDEDGFEKFEQYLNTTVNVRTKLLVDVIEEDFRVEQVPHVYGKDKAAVIGRLCDRHYRSSQGFTFAEVIGRDKDGRKDDKVLLSAITNPQLIVPWLNIIDSFNTPLSGIWTLPLVSKDILPILSVKADAVLLVSQQVNSNLRQSFFKNNKLISSRTSVVNQDDDQIHQIGLHAKPEITRTLSYLRAQRHIRNDELVEVHILASKDQISSLEKELVSSDYQQNYIHEITGIEKTVGLKGLDGKLSDGLFAWLCLKQLKTVGHYGKASDFKQFYYSLASSSLYIASIITLIFGVLVTEANISEAFQFTKSIELYKQQETKFKHVYDTKFREFETVLDDAKTMSASVKLVNQIKKGAEVSPLDFFIEISKALDESKIGDVSIDKIAWSTEQLAPVPNTETTQSVPTDLIMDYPVQHVVMLNGKIAVSSDDFRASVKRIHAIVATLKNHPRIHSVKTITMPVDNRSNKQFSADSGIKAKSNSNINQGAFTLQIRMEARSDD